MAHRERRGKAVDRSTPWTEWAWHADGYWYSSRYNENGEVEYSYPPEDTDLSGVPRTTEPSIFASTGHDVTPNTINSTGEDVSTYSNSDGNYSINPSYPSTTTPSSYAPSHYTTAGPQPGVTYSETPVVASSGVYYSTNSADESSNTYGLATSPDDTLGLGNLSLSSSGGATLDSRYQEVPVSRQKKFWKIGRVFAALWTEPARDYQGAIFSDASAHISETYLKGKAFSEIRRFVVVQEGYGNSICSPIHTYGNQATLKPNLPDAQQHAIIYTSDTPPDEYWYEADDGSEVREELTKDPIKVNRERNDSDGDLGRASRINYSKIYTIEHYQRVLNIGKVADWCIPSLQRNSLVQRESAPERPKPRPSRSSKDDRKGDQDKHRSRHPRRS